MKSVLVVALMSALLAACSFKHTTVEQPAPAAAVVVPDSPPSTTVIATPG